MTAEEARKITDSSEQNVGLKLIYAGIKRAAEDGKTDVFIEIKANSYNPENHIQDDLKKNGFDVSIHQMQPAINMGETSTYKVKISWLKS
jgi:hypothetical protein